MYIVHGWTTSIDKWSTLEGLLTKSGYSVEIIRIPGLTAPLDEPWLISDYVDYLDQVLPASPSLVIAHSNGGRLISAFNQKHPRRLAKLVLIGAAGLPETGVSRLCTKLIISISQFAKTWIKLDLVRRVWHKLVGARDYMQATPLQATIMKHLISLDMTEAYRTIACPTLLLWGQHDGYTPAWMGHKLNSLIQDSQLVVIPSARHAPFATHADQAAKLITRFLEAA